MSATRLPIVIAALALGLIPAGSRGAPAAAPRAALVAAWEIAQQASIAHIRDPKERHAAQRRFADARRELVAPAPPGPRPAGWLEELAKRELAVAGRYRATESAVAPPQPSWWDRLWTWLGDRVRQLIETAFGRARLGPAQANVLAYGLLALATLTLTLVAVRMVAAIQFDRRGRARAVAPLAVAPAARDLYAAACRCAESGDHARAARLLFAAAVAALELRGDVRNRRSATVGDLRGSLRSRDASLVPSFDAIARPFVTSAYAERPVRLDEWEAARIAYLSLTPVTPR